jgi:hypothetical protein
MTDTVDERVTRAREYRRVTQQRDILHQLPSELMREAAESRRQLAALLAVIGGQAVTLTYEQASAVLGALGEAEIYRAGDAAATTYRELGDEVLAQLRRAAGGAR